MEYKRFSYNDSTTLLDKNLIKYFFIYLYVYIYIFIYICLYKRVGPNLKYTKLIID